MAAVIDDIIIGVISNAIWASITHYFNTPNSLAINYRLVTPTTKSKDVNISEVLNKCAIETFKKTKTTLPLPRVYETYITDIDASVLLGQIFRLVLADQIESHKSAIIDRLSNSLKRYFRDDSTDYSDVASEGFRFFVEVAVNTKARLLQLGYLPVKDALDETRHKEILKYLTSLSESISFVNAGLKDNSQDIFKFETDLRSQIYDRNSKITPPNLDTHSKYPIEKLYVDPRLELQSSDTKAIGPQRATNNLDDFIKSNFRTVILGNPGAGKSTLAIKVGYDLTKPSSSNLITTRTPICIVLRYFGDFRKRTVGSSFVDYLNHFASSNLQLKVPTNGFETLLRMERLHITFDGLDELLDANTRRDVASDIESFARLYPGTAILVTSRKVGYDQAPLDPATFSTVTICDFDDGQVGDYVNKWFDIDTSVSNVDKDVIKKSFLQESMMVRDIRSNPLMLGLLCNIYRGDRYLPRNRPKVFEKCATLLFDKWDRSRGINPELPFEAHLQGAMEFVAYWMFADCGPSATVPESALVKTAAQYLVKWKYRNIAEAEAAAKVFVEFCKGRAWVLTDVGMSPDGESIFQFTHRTFLEYFTAKYLCKISKTPAELVDIIIEKVRKGEWDVVSQICLHIKYQDQLGAADEMIETILARIDDVLSLKEKWNLLSFCMRSLEFIVPKAGTIKILVDKYFDEIYRTKCTFEKSPFAPSDQPHHIIEDIHSIGYETIDNVCDFLIERIAQLVNSGSKDEVTHALYIKNSIFYEIYYPNFYNNSQRGFRNQFRKRFISKCNVDSNKYINEIYRTDRRVLFGEFYIGDLNLFDTLELLGVDWFFDSAEISGKFWNRHRDYTQPFLGLLNSALIVSNGMAPKDEAELLKHRLRHMSDFGRFVLKSSGAIATLKMSSNRNKDTYSGDIRAFVDVEIKRRNIQLSKIADMTKFISTHELSPDHLSGIVFLYLLADELFVNGNLSEYLKNRGGITNNAILDCIEACEKFRNNVVGANENIIIDRCKSLGLPAYTVDKCILWSKGSWKMLNLQN